MLIESLSTLPGPELSESPESFIGGGGGRPPLMELCVIFSPYLDLDWVSSLTGSVRSSLLTLLSLIRDRLVTFLSLITPGLLSELVHEPFWEERNHPWYGGAHWQSLALSPILLVVIAKMKLEQPLHSATVWMFWWTFNFSLVSQTMSHPGQARSFLTPSSSIPIPKSVSQFSFSSREGGGTGETQ